MVKLRAVRSDETAAKSRTGVRKSFYVAGGAVVGVALLAFVLVGLVGGDSGEPAAAPAAEPAAPQVRVEPAARSELSPGGRDPFRALVVASSGTANPAPAPEPEPVAPEASAEPSTLVEVLAVENGAANIRVGANLHEGVKPGAQLSDGFVLEAVEGECAFIARSPERFRVCEGERYLK